MCRVDEGVGTGEDTAEEFRSEHDRVALVATEGQVPAPVEKICGIGAGLAVAVDDRAGGQVLAAVAGIVDFDTRKG